jgi:hypothetical protein
MFSLIGSTALLGGMALLGILVSAVTSVCTAIAVICLLWTWRTFFPPEDRMSCPCSAGLIRGGSLIHSGGYTPTEKDLAALKRFKAGKSIGFTMRSSLKAKGLIPRVNGSRRVSAKYKRTRRRH